MFEVLQLRQSGDAEHAREQAWDDATSGTSAFLVAMRTGSDISTIGQFCDKGHGMGMTKNELVNNLEMVASWVLYWQTRP